MESLQKEIIEKDENVKELVIKVRNSEEKAKMYQNVTCVIKCLCKLVLVWNETRKLINFSKWKTPIYNAILLNALKGEACSPPTC